MQLSINILFSDMFSIIPFPDHYEADDRHGNTIIMIIGNIMIERSVGGLRPFESRFITR